MIKNFQCEQKDSILVAWRKMNLNSKGIIFIVDEENKLLGIATDGDIRRFLLKDGDINTPMSYVMNTDFVFGLKDATNRELLSKVNERVRVIPIIDQDRNLINIFDFKDIYHPIATPDLNGNELKYLLDAFLSTWISSNGEYIKLFENNFSKFINCNYGVAVSNGTTALHLAILTLNIGKGDEVIVPNLTFAATINAVLHANATPVIVDVEEDSWCIDPIEIEKAITSKTKAIIPVHLYGQPCDMEKISLIARKYNLFIIEDCAEAHGARFNGKKVGSFSDISCFSFFANKIITTGEGGMCLTNNENYDKRMRILRDHGMSKEKKYYHTEIGYNYRMTNLQAAIGVAQLERIDEILKDRLKTEVNYVHELLNVDGITIQNLNILNREKITWLVSILVVKNRDLILKELNRANFDARPFFYPLSEMDIYKKYSFSSTNSIKISQMGINLPTSVNTNTSMIAEIVNIIKSNVDV
jgi:perosamine synthetase